MKLGGRTSSRNYRRWVQYGAGAGGLGCRRSFIPHIATAHHILDRTNALSDGFASRIAYDPDLSEFAFPFLLNTHNAFVADDNTDQVPIHDTFSAHLCLYLSSTHYRYLRFSASDTNYSRSISTSTRRHVCSRARPYACSDRAVTAERTVERTLDNLPSSVKGPPRHT
jgi:hypothetical protein